MEICLVRKMKLDKNSFFLLVGGASIAKADRNSENPHLEERLRKVKLDLWSRGEYAFDSYINQGQGLHFEDEIAMLEQSAAWSSMRLGPVRKARRDYLHQDQDECIEFGCEFTKGLLTKLRGGSMSEEGSSGVLQQRLDELGAKFGQEFKDAIQKNVEDRKSVV